MKKHMSFKVTVSAIAAVFLLFGLTLITKYGLADHDICNGYIDESSCNTALDCSWDSTTVYCYSNTSYDSSCSSGYYWDSSTNTCMAGCESRFSQSDCQTDSECIWDSGSNSCYYGGGPSSDCGSFTSESDCNSYANCNWYSDSNYSYCYYDSSGSSGSDWVNHTWYFTDGSTNSYILNRTDQEYLDYITSIETQCSQISINQYSWMPNAGNDTNWQEFGIPDCTNSGSSSNNSCSAGYYWDSSTNTCMAGCESRFSQSDCAVDPVCIWDTGSNSCYYGGGNTLDCSSFANESDCTVNPDCGWNVDGSYCYYEPEGECTSSTPQASCESNPTCYWDSAYNTCYYSTPSGTECSSGFFWDPANNYCSPDCGYYPSQSECDIFYECAWDANYNQCNFDESSVGVECHNITSQSECETLTECSWDVSSQQCYFDSSDPNSNWVFHTWNFTDGSETSYILNRTDQEYLDYIVSIEDQCSLISRSEFIWMPDAGNDANWQEFGIPDCTGMNSPSDFFNINYNNTYPREGEFDVGTDVRIHVEFTKDIDQTLNYAEYFNVARIDSAESINGIFELSNKGFDFIPDGGLMSDATYSYSIAENLADIEGIMLGYTFYSSFTTGSGEVGDAATLTGTISGPLGNPIADAFVEVHTSDWSYSRGSPSDHNGKYTIFNIKPGSYLLDVYPPHGTTGIISPPSQSMELLAGTTVTRNLTFKRAVKTITGSVTFSDGSPVTNANVSAFQPSNNSWTETQTDASGNYKLTVSGGSWEINIWPSTPEAKWTYTSEPQFITFKDDETLEEQNFNFTVTATNAAVTGKVVLPDLSIPAPYTFSVGLRDTAGFELHAPVQEGGEFFVPVVSGTYSVSIWSESQTYYAPDIPPVTVPDGKTVDIGTIQLVEKQDKISGTVSDKDGVGISNIEVNAWQIDNSGYASTRSDESGNYELLVTPGKWEAHTYADPSTNFYNPNPPQRIVVESGISTTINFTLYAADAGISGTIVDNQGNILSQLYGYANLSKDVEAFESGTGGPIDRGKFSFKAPAGTYTLNIFLPSESPYTIGASQIVTLTSGTTLSVEAVVKENTSEITGVMKDEAGGPVTGFDAHVFAMSKLGIWQEAIFDKTTGKFTIKVASGTWYIGYDIDPSSGFISLHEPIKEIIVADGEVVVQDVVVQRADAFIKGRVTDPSGQGVFNAFVGASKTSFSGVIEGKSGLKDPIVAGDDTDADGYYTIAVPAGSYFVKSFVHPELGFINSKEENVIVLDGQTLTVDLILRNADTKITGTVYLNNEVVSDAFISGWSNQGGYQETFTFMDGTYQLNVTGQNTWVVTGAVERDGIFYKSNEIEVTVGESDVVHDIYLEKYVILPSSAIQTSSASAPTVVGVSDGATVMAPANAVSTSGSVSISVTPDTRAPSQGEVKVVGLAYDFEARDDAGVLVSSFNTDVTITIPYDDDEVIQLGATEDNLVMSFWDDTVATWKTLTNSLVNKEDNVVTASVNHFTRFAVVAAADIIPPDAPDTIVVDAQTDGTVAIQWINPVSDFHHAKIYRSQVEDNLGSIIANDIQTETFIDKQLSADGTYYYVVRSVDLAGNESFNKNQVSIAVTNVSAKDEPVEIAPDTNVPEADKTGKETISDEILESSIGSRLSGRILLQVQVNGEAWYIYPNVKQRYFLGRPDDAFRIMRELGLGISNYDLGRLIGSLSDEPRKVSSAKNFALAKRLSGMIILQVEAHGEAYYINPVDLKVHYLGRPADAFNIMRNLGLGITNDDLSTIPIASDSETPP